MRNYRENKPPGEQCLRWNHERYASLHQEYWIPQTYCLPEVYFKNLEADVQSAYYNRPCSVYEYYELVCSDTPGYVKGHVKGHHNRSNYRQAARHVSTSASSGRPVAHNPGFQRPQAPAINLGEDEALVRWSGNIVVDSHRSSNRTLLYYIKYKT